MCLAALSLVYRGTVCVLLHCLWFTEGLYVFCCIVSGLQRDCMCLAALSLVYRGTVCVLLHCLLFTEELYVSCCIVSGL